jgi:hypothetical protein
MFTQIVSYVICSRTLFARAKPIRSLRSVSIPKPFWILTSLAGRHIYFCETSARKDQVSLAIKEHFMDRRNFLTGSAVALAGQLGSTREARSETSPPLGMSRTSRLFDSSGMTPDKTFIQDVFPSNDHIYCLYCDMPKRKWGVTATTRAGAIVWHHDLPKARIWQWACEKMAALSMLSGYASADRCR